MPQIKKQMEANRRKVNIDCKDDKVKSDAIDIINSIQFHTKITVITNREVKGLQVIVLGKSNDVESYIEVLEDKLHRELQN